VLLEGFAPLLAAPALKVHGVEIALGLDCRLAGREAADGLEILTLDVSRGPVRVSLEVPLGDAEGYWFPNAGALRTLPPDWRGNDKTSIISSSPLGCLYDRHGRILFAFAFDQQIEESQLRFGVSEEHKTFVVYFEHQGRAPRPLRLALARPGGDYAATIGHLRDWLRDGIGQPLPVPFAGTVPVYCTWYTFSQNVDARSVEREAALAQQLGCRAVIIDDGWQKFGSGRWYAGCGDWVPDTAKFPDMAAHVERLHALGLSVMLWVAPLLLGAKSEASARLEPVAPHYSEGLKARVLDPRCAETRAHFVETCVRLVQDFGLDGLKIDFLDSAVVYQGTPTTGNIPDVGEALRKTLADLQQGLKAAGLEEVLIEFRQSYIGPATAPYGNLLRAGDCPADAILNRRSVIDTRLIAAGQVVHADPVMWDPDTGPVPAARQLLNAYFGVPQVSMALSRLPAEQLDAVRTVLASWMRTRDVVLRGTIAAGLPSENYPVVQARLDGRLVVGVYQPQVVDIDLTGLEEVTILNATASDEIVVRWSGAAGQARGEARDARGAAGTAFDFAARPGLTTLAIPPSGIATLDLGDF